MAPRFEGVYPDGGAPGVPGTYVVEVGPAGVAPKADQASGSQAPGWISIAFGDAEGLVWEETVEAGRGAGHLETCSGHLTGSAFLASCCSVRTTRIVA